MFDNTKFVYQIVWRFYLGSIWHFPIKFAPQTFELSYTYMVSSGLAMYGFLPALENIWCGISDTSFFLIFDEWSVSEYTIVDATYLHRGINLFLEN